MEKDLRVIEDLKNQIEKGRVNFKKQAKDRINSSYLNARLDGLEQLIAKFLNKHESLIATYSEEDLDASSYVKDDTFNACYEMYLTYKGELNAKLTPASNKDPNATSANRDCVAKLPKISIPFFSGSYSDFSSFKDMFNSLVHNNPALDNVQRLHYLKTQLKGEAEQLVKHIPITDANYKKCWELLSNRYENKRFVSNCILKRLFGQRSMNCESSQLLKELLDTTSDCMHELSSLGIDVESWDIIVIYVVSQKLDPETRKQWELHANNSSEDLPSLTLFKDFLESRFRALEFVEPSKNKSKPNFTKVLHTTSNVSVTCPHCKEGHRLYSCSKFAKENVANRQEIVKSLKLCYNCLGSNHFGKSCHNSTKCRICNGKHHTLLHGKPKPEPTAPEEEDYSEQSSETKGTTNIRNHFVTGQSQTLLATALIKAESKDGSKLILRALLDQGSQASFISEAAVQLLRLKKISVKSCISGLGDSQSGLTSKAMVMVNIQSLCDPSFKLTVDAHVLKTVTSILPEKRFILPSWTEIDGIHLADPQYNTPSNIDILLGSEVYCAVLKEGLIRSPTCSTIAQDTYLGWILSGKVGGRGDSKQNCHMIVSLHVKLEENELLKKFWELESEPSSKNDRILTPEERACEEHFKRTTQRDDAGRYVVELPFRSNVNREYGNTRAVAVKRLVSLEKRFMKNPNQKKDYSQVLNEYLSLGHMQKVVKDNKPVDKIEEDKVWLPHHAVVRLDKTTTKTRVVFNASDKSANGVSLNSTLMVGPTIQPELRHTVMRWRLHPICLTADIVKMYRQVKVAARHVDYQRIVWREDAKDNLQDYRLLTVTFGTSCAPYLAVKALQQVALDEGHNYPLAASRVHRDFYMDDLLTGCESESEAVQIQEQMNALLQKGGFLLQKWASNRMELLKTGNDNSGLNHEFKEDDVTKIVGLIWNRRTDEFGYNVNLSDASVPVTKREIIAEICRLYDPLGWIAPCIITAKIFIQKLWIAGLGWDDRLQEELCQEWKLYREELSKLSNFHIPRWVQRSNSDIRVTLHGFGDASNAAFAAVVYIRCISAEGVITTHLLTSKTKVAPIKQVSIPRLELCGAVLVTKLLCEVAETLNVEKSDLHAWTDSTVVLAWLSDHPSRWKTFVANRTSEILNLLDASQFSYVQSKDNPADGASRGLSASDLINSELWKYGPEWLRNHDIEYAKPRSICTKTELEARSLKVHTSTVESSFEAELTSRFSSLRKLVRVVAYCRRFLQLKDPAATKTKNLPYLTAPEIKESLTCCIKQHQQHALSGDITSILKQKEVSKKSKLSTLNPFIDKNGILRVGGRITNSDLPDNSKHPIILSGESPFAKLIVEDAHQRTMHGGQQLTCNYIRTRYWVTKLKSLVRSHIHHCVPCIRNAAKTSSQLMGQLPSCRVTPNKPFLHAGVDYAGPINIRVSKGRGQRSFKGYICLFICMATRAIHLEAVSDLTSEGFLSAFKRFVARRGRCVQLWSDNGTNFVGASRELKILLASELSSFSSEVASSLANNGTEWRFIPPHAPNFGGLWESGIKSTKHHLRRVIGDSTLTYEELSTVLCQIEACLNSRPLTKISTDPNDPMPLTPGHFLIGESCLIAPDHNYEQLQTSSLRRWQITQKMVQQFWRRWSQEYLTSFFQRYKWKTQSSELRKGDVVLVREDNLPPTKWVYGLVVDLHPGKDKITRVVTLRYKGSLIQRPTSKLCPLPVNKDD